MEGKVCLVTGATSGIGKEIALDLAKLGAQVAIVGRSKERCESAIQDIIIIASATERESRDGDDGIPSSSSSSSVGKQFSYFVADLSSQKSVVQLAKDFAARFDRLDVLINNAGIFMPKRQLTVDGIEYTLAVNHIAPFLLTSLLLDKLKASAPSRVITTSSIAHRGATIDLDDLQLSKGYSGIKAYGRSKLANILFTKDLARRLDGTGVTANCFHPGAIKTNLVRGSAYGLVWKALSVFFFSSPQKGADTAIYLASSPDLKGTSGEYFSKRKPAKTSDTANDYGLAERLWKASEQLVSVTGLP